MLAIALARARLLAAEIAAPCSSWFSSGFLFIINQGLWKETVQTLVLVVFATALSMLIGVPLGIWAAHKPRVWQITAADSRPDADHADLRLSHSHSHPVWPGRGPCPYRDRHFRDAGAGAHDVSGPHLNSQAHAGGGRKLSAPPSGNCCGRWNCRRRCPPIMAGLTQCIMLSLSMVVIATLIGAPEPWQSGEQGAGQPQHSARH